jgi:cation diffusion facilitator family transporter
MASDTKRTVVVAMGANLVIAIAKGVAGAISGAASMLAEAAHSVADTTNQVFLLTSLSLGAREPDQKHPFGYGRERFFWAFLAAIFIFVAGAVFSLTEGVRHLLSTHEALGSAIASFVVLGVSLVAESTSWVVAYRETRATAREKGVSVKQLIRETSDPTTKTVLFEDSAAVIGIVFAFAGLTLREVTGSIVWDGAASIAIGLLLVFVAYRLGRDTRDLLLGRGATVEDRDKITAVLRSHPEVDDVYEVLSTHLGPESLLVAVRWDLAKGLSSDDIEALSATVDQEIRKAVPVVTQVFLDATDRREHRAAEARRRDGDSNPGA